MGSERFGADTPDTRHAGRGSGAWGFLPGRGVERPMVDVLRVMPSLRVPTRDGRRGATAVLVSCHSSRLVRLTRLGAWPTNFVGAIRAGWWTVSLLGLKIAVESSDPESPGLGRGG
jgi:hypothetical protein